MGTQDVLEQLSRIRERANLIIESELRRRSFQGLVPAHAPVFTFLFKQDGPVAIKEIVKHTRRVKSTVTGMLNTLERHGYVDRSPSDADSRVTYITLTRKGRSLREHVEAMSKMLRDRLYGDMTQANRKTLARLLGQVEMNLQGLEETEA